MNKQENINERITNKTKYGCSNIGKSTQHNSTQNTPHNQENRMKSNRMQKTRAPCMTTMKRKKEADSL